MSVFPKIFIINLEHCKERRASITKQLDSLGLEYEITNAVDGNILSENIVHKYYSECETRKNINRSLSREEIGCYLSHTNIYRKIVEDNISHAIVLEDDIFLNSNFRTLIDGLLKREDHWDLVHLFHAHGCLYYWYNLEVTSGYRLRKFVNSPWGCAAYLLSGSAAEKVLQSCFPIFLPIDDFINRELKNILKIRGISPVFVKHLPEEIIESTMTSRNRAKQLLKQNIKFSSKVADYIKFNTINLYRKFNPGFYIN